MEVVLVSEFPISKQKNLVLDQQRSMKNLTIGFNALIGIAIMELNGLEALERVVIKRGGLTGGTGRLRVMNCTSMMSIDIGEFAFMKYKYLELVDLPLLQEVKLSDSAFQMSHTVRIDSNQNRRTDNQTCLHFNPFN